MAYNMQFGMDADLALAMKGLLDQQKIDYGNADGFDSYETVMNELTGSPSEATYLQYMYGVDSPISDGPISVLNDKGVRLDGGYRNLNRGKVKSLSFGIDGRDGTLSFDLPDRIEYDGPIGHFSYEPENFAFGYKRVGMPGAEADIPILYYVGNESDGNKINIPQGCTDIRYMFEGNRNLQTFPNVQEGVVYMNGAFKDCVSLSGPSESALQESQVLLDDGSRGEKVAKLADSVKSISGTFYGCKNLNRGYDYVSAYSDLRTMDNYGFGTQLPLNPERGLNLNDLMIGRELRKDGTGVILDSSAVREMELMHGRDRNYYNDLYEGYREAYPQGYSQQGVYYDQSVMPVQQDMSYDPYYSQPVQSSVYSAPDRGYTKSVSVYNGNQDYVPGENMSLDNFGYNNVEQPGIVETPVVSRMPGKAGGSHNLSRADRLAMAERLSGGLISENDASGPSYNQ